MFGLTVEIESLNELEFHVLAGRSTEEPTAFLALLELIGEAWRIYRQPTLPHHNLSATSRSYEKKRL